MLEGLHAVQARITEIRARFGETDPVQPTQPVQVAASSPGELLPAVPSFGTELQLALRGKPEKLAMAASSPQALEPLIREAASRNGLDPKVLEAVVRQESGFNPTAVSPAGAQGLMQLMPGTARALGVADPLDPAQNLEGGARYLRQQLDRFGELPLALAAYNAGPGAVQRHNGVPPFQETRNYVDSILGTLGQTP
ncbi:MAG TPA: lytic transglycosylase domain-containing protein [Armatimonadota bacterium]|jgi:soluble lytic murein transglycosylase-like protein